MKRDLTDAFLRTVRPPERGRTEIGDTRTPGLVFRVGSSGAASWCVRGTLPDGAKVRTTIGTYPAVGLAEARRRALEALAAISAGRDPNAAKRAAREARRATLAEPTVADRWQQWRDAKATRWSERHAREVARIGERDVLPALGARRMIETTRQDWLALIEAKRRSGSPAMAALLYRVCSGFLNHAEASGWIAAPLLPRKGAGTLAPPPASRDRVLTDDELRLVWRASERLSPKPRAFVRLLLLAACRASEAAGIRVGEVDWTSALWRLPGERAKNRTPHVMPLPAPLLAELQALLPPHAEGGDHILGRSVARPLQAVSKVKAALDKHVADIARAEGLDPPAPWRLHDLRRTARTGMARLGVPHDHAEAALNHLAHRSGLTRVYDRHRYEAEALDALRIWQAFVAGLIGQAAPVVPLRERRKG